jgi:hypothetical protein
MITFNKPMIVTAALIAAGLVAAIDMAQSLPQEASPASKIASRFPQASELMLAKLVQQPTQGPVSVSATKGDKLQVPANTAPSTCTREHWPYIADECLTTTDGAKLRRPARTITIERAVVANASAQIASR